MQDNRYTVSQIAGRLLLPVVVLMLGSCPNPSESSPESSPEQRTLTVSMNADSVEESEGYVPAFGTVTVDTADSDARTYVELTTESDRVAVESFVAINAGETTATFDLFVLDNGEPDFDEETVIEVAATGCTGCQAPLTVVDDESGFAVEIRGPSDANETYVRFEGFPGFMYGTDWAVAEMFLIPSDVTKQRYQLMRGQAFEDRAGDFSIEVRTAPNPQISHTFLPMRMNAGDGSVTLVADRWHTLVIQYDAQSETASLHVDGVLVDEESFAPLDDRENDSPLIWGGQACDPQYGAGEIFGETDTVILHQAMWKRLLSSAEIEAYEGSVDLTDPSLVFATAIASDGVFDLVGDRDGSLHGSPRFYRP